MSNQIFAQPKSYVSASFVLNSWLTTMRGTERSLSMTRQNYSTLNELYDITLSLSEKKCSQQLSDILKAQANSGTEPIMVKSKLLDNEEWTNQVLTAWYSVVETAYFGLTRSQKFNNAQVYKTLMSCAAECVSPEFIDYTLEWIADSLCIYRDRLIHFGTCPFCGAEMTNQRYDPEYDVTTWSCNGCGSTWSEADFTFKDAVLNPTSGFIAPAHHDE